MEQKARAKKEHHEKQTKKAALLAFNSDLQSEGTKQASDTQTIRNEEEHDLLLKSDRREEQKAEDIWFDKNSPNI